MSLRGSPSARRAVVSIVAVAMLAAGLAAAGTVTAGKAKAAAAVSTVGPQECGFAADLTGSRRIDVSRYEVCIWNPIEFEAINTSSGLPSGSMVVKFNEWFKTDPQSLTVTHGVALQSLSGGGVLEAGGLNIIARDPCYGGTPGCTSSLTGLAITAVDLRRGGTYANSWNEYLTLGSTPVYDRSFFGDGLIVDVTTNFPGYRSVSGVLVSLGNEFRCDTVETGYWGCVNRGFTPTAVLDAVAKPEVAPVAHHVKAAQDMLPAHPGKRGSGPALVRIDSKSAEYTANRDRACDKNPQFKKDPPVNTSCDEYPFASTQQSSSAPFSIMPVPLGANNTQGGVVQAEYRIQHILVSDEFYVSVRLGDEKSGSVAKYGPLNNQFNAYGDNASCADWSGGDATNSIALPNGQRAWFFSDSFLGNPASRRDLFGFSSLRNSIVVQNGSSMRTITGGNTCQEKNQSLDFWDRYAKTVAPSSPGFYWTGDQQLLDSDTVAKFYYHGVPSGDYWINDYSAVAKIPVSQFNNSVMNVTPTPLRCSTDPKVLWGTMTMKWSDGNVYIYGTGAIAPQVLYLAKTTMDKLTDFSSWQFLTHVSANGEANWSGSCEEAGKLPIGQATGGSVSFIDGTVWLTQDSAYQSSPAGDVIAAYPSSSPWGFGARKIDLYRPPEAHYDHPYFYQVYEPRIQAGLTSGANLVMSYNVNSAAVDTGCVPANNHDATIYRPRFVTIPTSWFNRYDAPLIIDPSDTAAANAAGKSTAEAAGDTIDGVSDWFDHWLNPVCPAVPAASNLKATPGSDGSVAMSWSAPGTDVWSYLYQCDSTAAVCSTTSSCTSETGGFTKQFGGLWILDKSIVVRPVSSGSTNGHTYTWYICSSGASSGKGGASNQVSGKVTVPVPAAPTGLHGSRSGTSITLGWNEVTFPTTGVFYTPFYWDITAGGTSANPSVGQAESGVTTTTFTVPNATHTYGFMLKASNLAGSGPASNTITM